MKLSINRNIVWCDLFVSRLAELGVRNVCISPGSRSTPLTLAFASNKKIKSFAIVDERSSAFFALGLAKKTDTPVAVVTTSGTAVAELYPAIIEAYYQRVPLIICTADRPPSLRNSGANQTINQQNIFKNHIRFFADAGLPNVKRLFDVVQFAEDAIRYSCFIEKGPVHLNFSFEKPFEPKSYTDKIDVTAIQKVFSNLSFELENLTQGGIRTSLLPCGQAGREKLSAQTKINFEALAKKFSKTERGLIIVGSNRYEKEFENLLNQLSLALSYPIYIDGSSSLRFGRLSQKNTIDNLTALVRVKNFQKHYDPELIIQFGGTPTSNVMLEFFKNSKAEKILANEFGDRNDPSLTAKIVLRISPSEFCESVIQRIEKNRNQESCWLADLRAMNKIAGEEKERLIEGAEFPFEGRVVTELLEVLPDKSNLMISNSLPIRDVDFFASPNYSRRSPTPTQDVRIPHVCRQGRLSGTYGGFPKQINVYTNRGASGIDGINSTALGIAKASKEPTYLIVGDLAFYHDMNGLHNAIKYKIPLTVVLINNGGGGIFESLPISDYKEYFRENFLTPLNIDFKKFINAYGGNFIRTKSWKDFREKIKSSSKKKTLTVIEILTDAKKSKMQRQNFWNSVAIKTDEFINEIKN